MSRTYAHSLNKALQNARRDYSTWVVAELDSDDMESRIIRAMPLDATETNEFLAWDGRILAICEKDGLVDELRAV